MAEYDLGKVKGDDGVGIASVEQTTTSTESGGTNVITVTKTDGSTSTFDIMNGTAGKDVTVTDSLDTETAGVTVALSGHQGYVLAANNFGNGTATIYNTADDDAGQSAGAVAVTLTNFPNATSLQEGARFRVVMDNDATFASDDDNKYMMAVNGGTSYPVTIGNVAAGIGWAQSGKSYEFVFTGSSYDCLSSQISKVKVLNASANTAVTFDDGWKTIDIITYVDTTVRLTIHINYEEIKNKNYNYFHTGYFLSSSNYGGVKWYVGTASSVVDSVVLNGTSVIGSVSTRWIITY